jgi:hypothetical protein
VDVDPPELTVPIGAVTVVADPLTGTAVVDYSDQISASDNVDGNVTITCDPPSGSTFATGETTVTCTASDDGPNANGGVNTSTATFTVIVNDEAGPIVTAPNVDIKSWYFNPSDPDWARIPIADYTSDVFAEDVVDGPISSNSIICERDDTPEDPLLTADDFEFSDEPYSITCTAKDSALNTGSASFSLTVNYLYDINLVPPKGRVRAGSSVPLDWSYSEVDEFGVTRVVDSSAVDVRVAWTKMIESPPGEPQCVTPDTTDPSTDGTSGVGDEMAQAASVMIPGLVISAIPRVTILGNSVGKHRVRLATSKFRYRPQALTFRKLGSASTSGSQANEAVTENGLTRLCK